MNTSDPGVGGPSAIALGAGAPVTAGPEARPGDGAGLGLLDAGLGAEIARLANQLFAQLSPPSSPVPPSHPGQLPTPGTFGLAPPTSAPAVPHQVPTLSAPFPKESDLRGVPTTVAAGAPVPGALSLGLLSEQPASGGGSPLYFLDIAGHPAAAPGGAPSMPETGAPGLAPAKADPALAAAPPAQPGSNFARPDGAGSDGGGSGGEAERRLAAAEPDVDLLQGFEVDSGTGFLGTGIGLAPRGLTSDLGFSTRIFDPYTIKRDFPILGERVNGRRLVWLDNAATTQKPRAVIDRLTYFYEHENSNVHRAAHTLAARATDAYESARDKVRRFLNASSSKDIVFVRGATEAINLVAKSWGHRNIQPGDEIVISWLEHHANIVPWQQLASEKGARLRVIPVDDRGQVVLEEYEKLLGPRTRLVSISQVSNALGTIVPVEEMIATAHRYGARVLVDGAQAVSHLRVDVQALDCDFYCFSGHKIFAPTGIGVLYGKPEILAHMPPWQGGGNMIADVTFEKTVYQPPPWRFEAGTGNIADAVGLGAALDYVSALGLENIGRYEHELLVYATAELARVPGLRLIGTAPHKAGVLSFVLDGVRTEDVGGMLDQEGIAVRSGHHCAQPILRRYGLESTVRASLAPYNTCEDIDALVAALLRIQSGRPRVG
jgi:cysteine desulfurase/selenocysteine lyase